MTSTHPTEEPQRATCGCGGECGGQRDPAEAIATVQRDDRTNLLDRPVKAGAVDGDLDVRRIPHDQRHATVLTAVAGLVPGERLIVAAPHWPQRLLDQIEQEVHGCFRFDSLVDGPEVWRVCITKDSCC